MKYSEKLKNTPFIRKIPSFLALLFKWTETFLYKCCPDAKYLAWTIKISLYSTLLFLVYFVLFFFFLFQNKNVDWINKYISETKGKNNNILSYISHSYNNIYNRPTVYTFAYILISVNVNIFVLLYVIFEYVSPFRITTTHIFIF